MPSAHAEFRIKRLNRPAAAANTWVNLTKWNKCGGPVELETLVGSPCWGAIDLASNQDMAAWRLLWLKDGMYYTWGRYWVPADAVQQRTERRSVPYAGWVKAGHVTQTEGNVNDFQQIEKEILADAARFGPSKIAFDSWNAASTANNLINEGLPLEVFIQGPRSYNPAMKALEIAYTSGRLCHGGDPVLRWNIANVVPRRDVNMNIAPDKRRSADRIDGAVCLMMAFGLAEADDPGAMDRFLSNVVSA